MSDEYIMLLDGEWVKLSEEKPTKFNIEVAMKFLETVDFEVISLYKVYTEPFKKDGEE